VSDDAQSFPSLALCTRAPRRKDEHVAMRRDNRSPFVRTMAGAHSPAATCSCQ